MCHCIVIKSEIIKVAIFVKLIKSSVDNEGGLRRQFTVYSAVVGKVSQLFTPNITR